MPLPAMKPAFLVPLVVSIVAVVLIVLGLAARWALSSTGPGPHELSKATWDEAVEGKNVFIKFLAPW